MLEVLNVVKKQIKIWKEDRIKIANTQEESKNSFDPLDLNQKALEELKARKKFNFVRVNELMASEKMSSMIGDKIIKKIFKDNLRDFESGSQEDMEPILNICSCITRVLSVLKELDVKYRASIEG